ncbi:transcriptional regulator, TetR family [Sporobacter termitidis DSM 10068]|uniref:Transcriptional regulator, TetR family n=1 Tax=Sporobacter termitidis DSM 10068 TaxID=1123282 RepID=A0A1M5ZD20_9FIRM|nr:TetR-like C-terminal domain-containing protein [Sporobacter termitidis]SHI22084.1 transcriptional regulator, TetR family [Sporobacter termitidis DSM 10068]
MKADKIDRRVRYTTLLLKESLVRIMQEHPISRISVKMLCNAADINRSTFYAHYADQYDLLQKVEQDAVRDLREYVDKHDLSEHSEETTQTLKQILDYIAKDADLFKVLLSENGDSNFKRDIMEIAQQKAISDIRNYQALSPRTSDYLQCFIISGALRLVQKWLEDGMIESTQELGELISRLLFKGTSSFYSNNGIYNFECSR